MIKAILFDIDGTILDSYEFIYAAFQYTLEKHQKVVAEDLIIQASGKPLVEFYQFILPEDDAELLAQTHREWQEDKHHLAKPFYSVIETFKQLKKKKIKLAGVSSRTSTSLIKSLKTHDVYKYFDLVLGFDDVENPKPHPEQLLKAMKVLKVKKTETLMVGDTEKDIQAGQAAGIKTAGVAYGWMGENIKDLNPDYVITDLEELLKVVK